TSARQITRIVQLSGQAFPADLAERFAQLDGDRPEDKAAVRAFGVEVATDLCRTLLDEGVPGIHFITMNRSTATREVYANLATHPSVGADVLPASDAAVAAAIR
ncbi:MAG: methylenetetrahydrofolate reductase, partial [Actinomycetes bacterium]